HEADVVVQAFREWLDGRIIGRVDSPTYLNVRFSSAVRARFGKEIFLQGLDGFSHSFKRGIVAKIAMRIIRELYRQFRFFKIELSGRNDIVAVVFQHFTQYRAAHRVYPAHETISGL